MFTPVGITSRIEFNDSVCQMERKTGIIDKYETLPNSGKDSGCRDIKRR